MVLFAEICSKMINHPDGSEQLVITNTLNKRCFHVASLFITLHLVHVILYQELTSEHVRVSVECSCNT